MRPSLADLSFLADAEFSRAERRAIARADKAAEWYSLPGGWTLYREDETSDHLHFVATGALVAHRRAPENGVELVGHIRAGFPVGEMALISGAPHSATASALRDSEILSLHRDDFGMLVRRSPRIMQAISRLMLARARSPREDPTGAQPRVFALFAASPSVDAESAARELAAAVSALGRKCIVIGEESVDKPTSWLDEIERAHDVVIAHSKMADTAWYKTCLRIADRMWVIARRDARPSKPTMLVHDENAPARVFRLVDVVMRAEGSPSGASALDWMEAVGANRFLHWKDAADTRRLARIIAGLSVGLVLSGGGARAYSSVGVVRALRERGLEFDLVGGASMGAVVAAGVAMGWDDDEIEARVRRAFVDSNPIGDLRVPVVALSAGKRVEARLQEHFGEIKIEDLHLPFFATSTNLSAARQRIHRAGLLRHALRASIAIPGLLPPVVVDDDVLVDGAVLNNFPVDVMRALHRGSTIGVDVTRERSLTADDFRDPPNFLGWILENGMNSPPPIASLLMRAATVQTSSLRGESGAHCVIAPALADVELRDWRRFEDAVEAGYVAAQRAFDANDETLERARAACAAKPA